MQRLALAVLAAFALVAAAPAFACEEGCKNCPAHKKEMAQAAEKDKKGDPKDMKAVECNCGAGKECKCAAGCKCDHCAAKKKEEKKTT